MRLIDQPLRGRLGDMLIGLLESGEFTDFHILSAYVKASGVERLRGAVESFRKKAGKHVWAGVGIDQRNTSIQGLQGLLSLCDGAWVYHNKSMTSTFHPKVYVLSNPKKAVVFVGSGNLTGGGLFTNYEAIVRRHYNLVDPKQAARFKEVMQMFTSYTTESEFCQKLTPELIASISDDYLSDETKKRVVERGGMETGKSPKKDIFGSKTFPAPPLPKGVGGRILVDEGEQMPLFPEEEVISAPESECDWSKKGRSRWSKKLTDRDCQVVSSVTHPTGGLSLTQAKWVDKGKLIDPVTYFRFDLFAGFLWGLDVSQRGRTAEVAKVKFCVKVSGKERGKYTLTLRYNPKWESKERNYTTGLAWGDLMGLVKGPSLVGKAVSIYDPPSGQSEPFFLEIG